MDKLNILKQEIEDKFNIIPIVFCCDVSKSEEVKSVLNKIQKLNYYVDLLVNCAGKSCGGNTIDITDEEWDDVIKTNLNSIFYITRGLLSRNMIRKDGRIINISTSKIQFLSNTFAAKFPCKITGSFPRQNSHFQTVR